MEIKYNWFYITLWILSILVLVGLTEINHQFRFIGVSKGLINTSYKDDTVLTVGVFKELMKDYGSIEYIPIGYVKAKWFLDKEEGMVNVESQGCGWNGEGGSMKPMIMPGWVYCYKSVKFSELKEGQIAVYNSDYYEGEVAHLIDAVYPSEKKLVTVAIGFGAEEKAYSRETISYNKLKGIVTAIIPVDSRK